MGPWPRITARVLPVAVLCVVVVVSGCGDEAAAGDAASGVSTGELWYALDWDLGAATLTDDGWEVRTPLGYDVAVGDAYLVTYGAQLVACDAIASRSSAPRRWARRLARLLAPSVAYAGHGATVEGPTALIPSRVESLRAPVDLRIGPLSLDDTEWCRLFFLTARADDETEGMPTDVTLDRTTLYLAGTWSRDGSAPAAFELRTSDAGGAFFDFPDLDVPLDALDGAATGATVRVVRRLDALVETLDFAADGFEDQAGDALDHFVDELHVEVITE